MGFLFRLIVVHAIYIIILDHRTRDTVMTTYTLFSSARCRGNEAKRAWKDRYEKKDISQKIIILDNRIRRVSLFLHNSIFITRNIYDLKRSLLRYSKKYLLLPQVIISLFLLVLIHGYFEIRSNICVTEYYLISIYSYNLSYLKVELLEKKIYVVIRYL